MISVIIPVYNVKAYLAEAVESVIHQTYQYLEIILVDDGSTDGSGEICDEYAKKDNRIKVIHQQNKGLSAARNAGLDICQGEIISFLDSDDVFRKDMLEKMYAAMEKTGADIVECGIVRNDGGRYKKQGCFAKGRKRSSKESGRLEIFDTREALRLKVRGKIKIAVWNKIYKRKIWEQLRFREGHNYEDLDIILPMLSKAQTVCRLENALVIRRIRKDSITQSNKEENVVDRFESYQHYMSFVDANIPNLFDQEDKRAALLETYPGSLRMYFRCVSLGRIPRKKHAAEMKKAIAYSWHSIEKRKCGVKAKMATAAAFLLPPMLCGAIYRIYWHWKYPIF
ncbi:MAG: glycosyltransferase family 2 protein [Lachnospiraceae bacterium]|nr:glycosyltransferase family 2 protein [Lachnospiraceae bacterium]